MVANNLKLSNSAMEAFWKCPEFYRLRYQLGLDKAATPDYLQFGQRFHSILQAHYTSLTGAGLGVIQAAPYLSSELENEAQAMFQAYKSHYPQEDFEPIEFEKEFRIEEEGYVYAGRIDMLVRRKLSGKLAIFETKTENRNSKRNLPQAWTARHQASLYLWAAGKLYNQEIDGIILNVCTRGTAGKQIGPTFRRDDLHRTPAQVEEALKSFKYVSDIIGDLSMFDQDFPRNTQNCVNDKGFGCEYFGRCHMGSDDGLVTIDPYGYLSL